MPKQKQKQKSKYSALYEKIKEIFKNHIGEENAISPIKIYEKVFYENPLTVHLYERQYKWSLILKALHHLRKTEECYIINRHTYLFVLKTEGELKTLDKRLDNLIDSIKKSKIKAKKWVRGEKWRNL